jgi:GDP-4-dehydro-6-deoxy-D-mannose reductase
MRVLITGITGFVGSHFAEYALARGATVAGTRWRSTTENIDHLGGRLALVECDLCDLASVRDLLETARPEWVIHLAAQSFVGVSWDAPAETLTNNIVAQVNLLEAIRQGGSPPRILVVGSSEEYGFVEEHELPVAETNPFRPLSPYGVSKVAQDLLGYQYWKSYGLPIVRSRAFTHSGPRRGDLFVESSFARQVAEIEQGLREPAILVGNLKAQRDYTDVRDIVRGYWLLLERGEPGEVYNLCTGRAWTIQAILDFFLAEARVRPIEVHEDPARLRPSDVPVLVGDASKIRAAIGWHPEVPFEQTLRDVLAYWRARVRPAAV